MKRNLVLLCLAALVAACATESVRNSTAPTVYEKRLDNGLKVLVKPDTRAPVVVSQIWYKIGGSYEPYGNTGASHVLEHMMFKGTGTMAPNEFSRIISALGGQENAFTGRDYTAYFQTLEKSHLETAFRLESGRMHDLVFDPAEFEKEIEVVKEERRSRTDDRPEALTYERFMAEAYRKSSYRNPIIGWPADLAVMRVDDLERWYSRFYAPNNATLVVVGDVEPDQVFDLAEKHFGGIPARVVPQVEDREEPAQSSPRRIEVRTPARVPYLLIGYHVPVIATVAEGESWVPYALEVAAYLLDGGKSARLHSELVRKQRIASSAGASYDPLARKDTTFLFSANPSQGETAEAVEAAIKEQISIMSQKIVSKDELDRVKAQIVAGKVFEQDSSFYQGMLLGLLETNGMSWKLGDEIADRLRAVTAEQVREVVNRYMTTANSTVAVLVPEGGSEG
jgi:zinc protease